LGGRRNADEIGVRRRIHVAAMLPESNWPISSATAEFFVAGTTQSFQSVT
jgi:hypothetical protein